MNRRNLILRMDKRLIPYQPYEFGNLPKSRYWRRTSSHRHLYQFGLTPQIITETLQHPTDVVSPNYVLGRHQEFYRYYPPGTNEINLLEDASYGAWFRAVIDPKGALYTAFRDHYTELQGGRDCYPTPDTTRNF